MSRSDGPRARARSAASSRPCGQRFDLGRDRPTGRGRLVSTANASSFEVHGHHYALVDVECLMPGEATAYDVRLDVVMAWPEPASPFSPSLIRPHDVSRPFVLTFGSCHPAVGHTPELNRLGAPNAPESNWRALKVFLVFQSQRRHRRRVLAQRS